MMARRSVFGLLAGGVAAVLSGCGLFGGNSYRFKMTVEVETPEGVMSGSSVFEIEAKNVAALTPGGVGRKTNWRGEAVAVDLPDGKVLFALLKTVNPKGWDDLAHTSMVALDRAYRYDVVESAQRIARGDGITSPAEVAAENYPMLVTFTDITDPRSVERVEPGDLAASFGPGVRLKRIWVEVTDDAVTSGIEKRLGWLKTHTGMLVKRERNTPIGEMPLEHRLVVTDFELGSSK